MFVCVYLSDLCVCTLEKSGKETDSFIMPSSPFSLFSLKNEFSMNYF